MTSAFTIDQRVSFVSEADGPHKGKVIDVQPAFGYDAGFALVEIDNDLPGMIYCVQLCDLKMEAN